MFKKWMAGVLTVALILTTALASLSIGAGAVTYGDANGDGDVNMKDVLIVRKHIAGMDVEIDKIAADVNGDSSIDMKDVLLLRKFIAQLIADFPVSEQTPSEEPSDVELSEDSSADEPSQGSSVEEPSVDSSAEEPSEDSSAEEPSVDSSPEEPSVDSSPEEPSVDSSPEEPSEDSSPEEPSEDSGETSDEQPVDQVTLTVNLTEESPRYTTHAVSGSWTYQKGAAATFTVSTSIYRADTDRTIDQLKSYVTLTGATLQGDPVVGARGTGGGSQDCLVTYTYTVVMSGNVTVTGTVANPNFNPATLSANAESGEVSGGASEEPSEQSSEASTDPVSEETSAETSESSSEQSTDPPSGDTCSLTLNVTEYVNDKYTTQTRTDTWNAPKNTPVTFLVTLPSVYKGNEKTEDQLKGYINLSLNGSAITPVFSFGPVKEHNCEIYATYTVTLTGNSTVTGTIQHPSYKQSAITLNGEPGEGITLLTEPIVVTADHLVTDMVTLTYNDAACQSYGVSWYTYVTSASPAVQVVEGTATKASDFAMAASIAASTSTYTSDEMYLNYDPENEWFFSNDTALVDVTEYIHRATLTGLSYNTTYSYRVGDTAKNEWSDIYTFTTRPQTVGNFSFAYLSDSQFTTTDGGPRLQYRAVLQAAEAQAGGKPAFFLHGGDIVDIQNKAHLWGNLYGGNSKEIFSKYPFFAAIGNHDSSATRYLDHWNFNSSEAYFSYTYGDVHVIVLNDGPNGLKNDLGSKQYSWLVADLQANTSRWTIVTLHRPIYCAKTYDQNANPKWGEGGQEGLRDQLSDLFAQYGVDLVLQGHTHHYAYTYPVAGKGSYQTDCATVTSGGVTCFKDPAGPVYAVIGTAGTMPDDVIGDGSEYAYICDAQDGQKFSFATVDVTSDTLIVKARYVDGASVGAYGDFGIKKTS